MIAAPLSRRQTGTGLKTNISVFFYRPLPAGSPNLCLVFLLLCQELFSLCWWCVLLCLRLRGISSLSCVESPSMEKTTPLVQRKGRRCTPRTTRCWVSLWVNPSEWKELDKNMFKVVWTLLFFIGRTMWTQPWISLRLLQGCSLWTTCCTWPKFTRTRTSGWVFQLLHDFNSQKCRHQTPPTRLLPADRSSWRTAAERTNMNVPSADVPSNSPECCVRSSRLESCVSRSVHKRSSCFIYFFIRLCVLVVEA